MIQRRNTWRFPIARRPRAFSLVELIFVIAIMIIMMALLAPAINSMTSTAGRKGAINILMNTFEQARAAALESGANVYVVLWKRQFPDQDSIIVMRELTDWEREKSGSAVTTTPAFIPLTRYLQMPQGVLLYDGKGKNVFKGSAPADNLVNQLPKVANLTPAKADIGYIQFSPTGAVVHPEDKNYSRLFVSEGVRGNDGNEALIAAKKGRGGGFEIISFRRFTGRASVDVSLD